MSICCAHATTAWMAMLKNIGGSARVFQRMEHKPSADVDVQVFDDPTLTAFLVGHRRERGRQFWRPFVKTDKKNRME